MANMMKRVPVAEQEPKVRAKNFEEVCLGYSDAEAKEEADRCLNCKNPKCVVGCPVSIQINDFITQIKEGNIEKAAEEGNHMAKVALDAFRYRVAKYIGAYAAAMNGVDAISFTAGVGENDKVTRQLVVEEYLGYLGAKIDPERNDVRGKERLISTDDSKVKIFLIPTNEELAIARDTKRLIEA